MGFWDMLDSRSYELQSRLFEHLKLSGVAMMIAILVGVPMGVLALRFSVARTALLGGASIVQTIPSLALLTFLLPFFGIGAAPAIVALILYALLPIVRNTYTGLGDVPKPMLEMADALGMTRLQRLRMVESRFAAPVIMAGVRTAATVSIGIATLSAFVGAGGLGAFINRGLSLNNTDLVLLGAIPAGLLALYVDWLLGVLEAGLRPRKERKKLFASGIAAVLVGLSAMGMLASSAARSRPEATGPTSGRIVVGSKNFTEQFILAEIIAQTLERETDLEVVRKVNLAGTAVCQQALESGDIDLYPEYSGTALLAVLKVPATSDPAEAWTTVKEGYRTRFDLEWLPPLGFANTYALAVRQSEADAKGWQTIDDLRASAARIRGGFTSEFLERDDGYPGLARKYGFRLGTTVDMDPSLMYEAVRKGDVDVISAFSTDGRIAAFDLALLEDTRRFFPPYDAAIVARSETLKRYPEARQALESLSGKLTEAVMQELNRAVDQDGKLPRDVARAFLEEQGL